MRWIVEVSSLESGDSQAYCVEAESWQGALQSARRLRGDDSRMAGFSIDITNEGCRAVDPASRRRYDVKRAGEETPLSPGGEAAPQSARRGRASSPPSSKKIPEAERTVPRLPDATMPIQAVSSDIELPSSERLPRVAAAAAAAPAPAPAPVAAAAPKPSKPAVAKPEPGVPPVLIAREQEATAEVPLTYREYAFSVPEGTTEDAAAQVLLVQYARIKRKLEAVPAGKLVNLAAFDVAFNGRPPVLPVATLTWKDWRGEPTTSFPRRPKPAPAPVATPVAVAPAPAPVAVAPAPAPAPVAVAPAPAPAPVPVPAAVALASAQAPKVPSRPPPPHSGTRRIRGDELIAVLFEEMHDLHFQRDAIDGADFCLRLALEKLPSRFGVVHLYDIDRREFVVVAVRGSNPPAILLRRTAEHEPVLSMAMRRRRAMILTGEDLEIHGAVIGNARNAMLAPVMQVGRFLGAIELVDPEDAVPFTELDANALSYMAEQYAEFVGTRGVVVDPERISAASATAHPQAR